MRRIRLVAAISAGLALTAGAVAPVSARTGSAAAAADAPARTQGATVRLITGDRVTVTTGTDGRQIASVRPGAGRQHIVFRTFEQDGHLTVLPSDAGDLVSAGRLDRQLFDVTALVAQRYDEAHTDALPLIVGQDKGVTASAVRDLTALAEYGSPVRRLDSIGARSLQVAGDDLGRFWKELTPADGQMNATELSGTPRVWLDGRVDAALDRSTAQIGAPDVWQAGYRGEGVKVAVLDTGVDQTHPDLAGRISEAKDFSGSSGTGDKFGHGTHVAATVGGTGAASGGSRKGVAPAAQLLVGKVLGDDGFGSESQVIAGMEWATAQGAKVVNMSLGADGATDGTDPMSLALNELSERTGALFVVAAGNTGEQGPGTVGSPGAADAALTVGAVDRDDSLASFSSRGPRVGDNAVKPDVTAPGVGIVAARAAGTAMGTVVDDNYVAASGTSMATPHVAGAAALLAQRHPDWTGAQLKDALISTARTIAGQEVTEQGGGRIDVARAALGPVTATGTVTLGPLQTGAGSPRTTKLRYTNTSDTDVTLALTAKLTTSGGRAPADGTLRLGVGSVSVPAGATAEVPLTVDPSRVQKGKYYGYVTAASADGKVSVHTTLSLVVHSPTRTITLKTYDKDGKRVQALPTIWGADGFVGYPDPNQAVTEVEEGTYQVDYGSVDNASDGQELRQVVLPEVKVTKDMTVTLDARKTVPVQIRTPKPAEQRGILSYQTYRKLDGHSLTAGTMYFDIAKRLYISPTTNVTEGTFEFASRWQLVAPQLKATVQGTGADLGAYYMPASPLFGDRGARLTAVDAGDAAAPAFGRARGKLAVLTNDTGVYEEDLIERAAAAGVRAVMLVHFDDNAWTRWNPDGDRWAVPTVRIGAHAGADLLARIGRGATTVTITGTPRSPYLYDVMQVSSQRIPQQVVYTVSERNSAVVRSEYADNGGNGWAAEQRFGWRPYQNTAWLQYTRSVPTGFERTEYVSSGDTTWQHLVHHTTAYDVDLPLSLGMRDTPRTYRAGQRTNETWQGAVVRPSIPRGTTTPSVRHGNVLELRIPEFTDSAAGHWSRLLAGGGGGISGLSAAQPGDSASAVLYRNGTKAAEADGAWTDFEVPAGAADYRLDLTTSRVSNVWKYGIATDTSWTFRSTTTTKATALPLLQLDYDVPVDAHNAVGAGRAHSIGLTVRAQDGLSTPRGVRVQVEASYDDGRSWTGARVSDRGHNAFRAVLKKPSRVHGDAYVTLRVTARDAAGNTVRQTVKRAYLQHG
ncbi:S8 family serine peptidase [Streptomyces yaanensis]|uniref:S8 family serine peptidase n=1 Tax=Streptomyces yaanensis TaxID=1142239 RepID=A0ABV7SA48_9ACTN|nr:S8 family serine peptidase [Streptomyces sp. CGMCC 4.7035]WNC00226.1 S8 family serine peptidase [Streptomyces sp. CGMCC 4.7035]